MPEWLTLEIALVLMIVGVGPSFMAVYLLSNEWQSPGVLWFLVSMAAGGLWAFLFTVLTVIPSDAGTRFVANFFWPVIPVAAISFFLLAYEFVFKTTVSRRVAAAMFAPVALLFVLAWFNPGGLVFSDAYHVDADGFLHFPLVGGILRLLIVQAYGYTLVFLAAGMFVGEAMRTDGLQRRQTLYLLLVFLALVGSTVVKVAGLVPVYYDPTSTVYAFSGLFFAYSINRHGLLRFVPVAREHAFEEVDDALVVVNPSGRVIDVNESGRRLFGARVTDTPVAELLGVDQLKQDRELQSIQLTVDGVERDYSLRATTIRYGRGASGQIVMLSDITRIKERERELQLLKEIFARVIRHNIRNDLSIIDGYAELIREEGDEEARSWATHIRNTARQLLAQSDKARTIEGLIGKHTTERQSLQAAVADAVEPYRETAGVEIQTSISDVELDLHPKFSMAIDELIDNAIEHQAGNAATTITISTYISTESCSLVIRDDGPGLPKTELAVLQSTEETDLKHSSGLGLWLVRWIVAQSNGTVTAERATPGTKITIRLPRPNATDDRQSG